MHVVSATALIATGKQALSLRTLCVLSLFLSLIFSAPGKEFDPDGSERPLGSICESSPHP